MVTPLSGSLPTPPSRGERDAKDATRVMTVRGELPFALRIHCDLGCSKSEFSSPSLPQ